ncbi:hypothetical protein ABBQ38_008888 [Trebouxia sp. C0009 RCD-2024]
MGDDGEKVQLYVYDLSNGLARQLSPMLLNKQIDGIWHTSIVVGGLEYFYGGGVNQARPGSTPFGQPLQVIDLGVTQIPKDIRDEYLRDMRKIYTPQAYSLFHNNCNNFTNDFSTFLTGSGIPAHITGLPQEVLATPLGQMLAPMLSPLEQQLGNIHQQPAGESGPAAQQPASTASGAQPSSSSVPSLQAPQSVTAAAAAPAGLPQLPTRPAAAKAAADAAAKRATAASLAMSNGSAPSNRSVVNNGPAIKQAAEEIAEAAGLAMADAGVPQTSGQTGKAPLQQSQAVNGSGLANGKSGANGLLKNSVKNAVPAAASAKDVALKAKIEAEFSRLMAQGGMSANEAALIAVKNVGTAQASMQA